MARADGSLRSLLARLSRIDALVIGDWVMAPLSERELEILIELLTRIIKVGNIKAGDGNEL